MAAAAAVGSGAVAAAMAAVVRDLAAVAAAAVAARAVVVVVQAALVAVVRVARVVAATCRHSPCSGSRSQLSSSRMCTRPLPTHARTLRRCRRWSSPRLLHSEVRPPRCQRRSRASSGGFASSSQDDLCLAVLTKHRRTRVRELEANTTPALSQALPIRREQQAMKMNTALGGSGCVYSALSKALPPGAHVLCDQPGWMLPAHPAKLQNLPVSAVGPSDARPAQRLSGFHFRRMLRG